MTAFRCEACGRELAADTAFCPYCGADRRPAPASVPAPVAAVAEAPPIPAAPAAAAEPAPTRDADPPSAPMLPPTPPAASPPAPSTVPATERPRRKRRGCATPLLVVLLIVLAGVSWCAWRRSQLAGPPGVAGAVAVEPVHLTRRWRTVRLPGDAPATARFAVSSDTALRVRVAGRIYAVKPGRPLRLPDDLGESFDLRAADYVSSEDAAKARVALSTLRGE